jgi:crotonobetainyl-CoA:carnitine CoA-transferase CaiB-like acyl-CoA transferase
MIRSLEGVRVLDLTQLPPGGYCRLRLSDLGADVVRVEPPGSDPLMGGIGVSLNRGKRSVALDLRHEHGSAAWRRGQTSSSRATTPASSRAAASATGRRPRPTRR